jgi:predicted nuclease of predicted toxin-antitoxin system
MKIFADACIEAVLVERLRAEGHDVASARDHPPAARDAVLLAQARAEHRVFLTNDLDFGELAVRRQMLNCGVIIMRLDPLPLHSRIERAVTAIRDLAPPPAGVLCVIEPARARRRASGEQAP